MGLVRAGQGREGGREGRATLTFVPRFHNSNIGNIYDTMSVAVVANII